MTSLTRASDAHKVARKLGQLRRARIAAAGSTVPLTAIAGAILTGRLAGGGEAAPSRDFRLVLSSCGLTDIPDAVVEAGNDDGAAAGPVAIISVSLDSNLLVDVRPDITVLAASLTTLDLTSNHLAVFPPAVLALTRLEKLFLGSNDLIEVPEEVKVLINLEFLMLENTRLTGLPRGMIDLAYLSILDLRGTALTLSPASGLEPVRYYPREAVRAALEAMTAPPTRRPAEMGNEPEGGEAESAASVLVGRPHPDPLNGGDAGDALIAAAAATAIAVSRGDIAMEEEEEESRWEKYLFEPAEMLTTILDSADTLREKIPEDLSGVYEVSAAVGTVMDGVISGAKVVGEILAPAAECLGVVKAVLGIVGKIYEVYQAVQAANRKCRTLADRAGVLATLVQELAGHMMRDGAENIDYGAVKMALDRVKAALTEALELISTWEGYSKKRWISRTILKAIKQGKYMEAFDEVNADLSELLADMRTTLLVRVLAVVETTAERSAGGTGSRDAVELAQRTFVQSFDRVDASDAAAESEAAERIFAEESRRDGFADEMHDFLVTEGGFDDAVEGAGAMEALLAANGIQTRALSSIADQLRAIDAKLDGLRNGQRDIEAKVDTIIALLGERGA